ncbi:unnamed protein product [Cochlearia groenlandica]
MDFPGGYFTVGYHTSAATMMNLTGGSSYQFTTTLNLTGDQRISITTMNIVMAQSAQALARALAAKGNGLVARKATLQLRDTEMEEKVKKLSLALIGRLLNQQPSFAPNYPSTVSFWVKLLDVLTHIVDDAILNLVGNVTGKVEGMDPDSGSVCVTIDGYEKLLFGTIVLCDSGIKRDVSLDYDRLVGLCIKCFKITHDETNCPETKAEVELAMAKRDEKGKETYANVVAHNINEHKWENPSRASTKRALDFIDGEHHVFHYKKVGRERQHGTQREIQHRGREESLSKRQPSSER